jgi:hypothetical protein
VTVVYIVYALVALLGTAVQLWRHPADRAAPRAVEVASSGGRLALELDRVFTRF